MLFSWYAADYTTDKDFANTEPEDRANPSRLSWDNEDYLDSQRRRLPAHKFRRLHLNLPGTPEGAAFQPEPVMAAVDRGVSVRRADRETEYSGFVDMSGGSSDDATVAIAHRDIEGRVILDRVVNQGQHPPFDPRQAVERFIPVLRDYRIATVIGDAYAGETFRADFERHHIGYEVSQRTRSQLYEALEPLLNGHQVRLLDVPVLEQQFLGLIWRGGKIDHPSGEHDDWANAAAGVLVAVAGDESEMPLMLIGSETYKAWESLYGRGGTRDDDSEPDQDSDEIETLEMSEATWAAMTHDEQETWQREWTLVEEA
jgi:hypothetical protein